VAGKALRPGVHDDGNLACARLRVGGARRAGGYAGQDDRDEPAEEQQPGAPRAEALVVTVSPAVSVIGDLPFEARFVRSEGWASAPLELRRTSRPNARSAESDRRKELEEAPDREQRQHEPREREQPRV